MNILLHISPNQRPHYQNSFFLNFNFFLLFEALYCLETSVNCVAYQVTQKCTPLYFIFLSTRSNIVFTQPAKPRPKSFRSREVSLCSHTRSFQVLERCQYQLLAPASCYFSFFFSSSCSCSFFFSSSCSCSYFKQNLHIAPSFLYFPHPL